MNEDVYLIVKLNKQLLHYILAATPIWPSSGHLGYSLWSSSNGNVRMSLFLALFDFRLEDTCWLLQKIQLLM
jgi:hypothetical protein